jgi:pimeloyl-ACP methyl ester carboxylesterase
MTIESMKMKYEVSGPRGDSSIVFLPGGLSGWVSWKPHAEILSKNHGLVRVQLINMAAAEENKTPPEGYSIRMESDALKNTLDELNAKKINLVGWSHGGEVSLDFALNYPERIRTLTLIDPAAYWVALNHHRFEKEIESFLNLIRAFKDPVREEDLISFLSANDLIPLGMDPRKMPQWHTWNSLKIALLSLYTVIEHMDKLERFKRLAGIPVLLVRGRESRGFNSGIIDLLAEDLGPASRTLDLPDGHACHIVARDQFIAGLEKFIGDP